MFPIKLVLFSLDGIEFCSHCTNQVPYTTSLLHSFQPKPLRPCAFPAAASQKRADGAKGKRREIKVSENGLEAGSGRKTVY